MQIKKLKIKSFRGIKNKEYDLTNGLNVFEGKNGVGKTTLLDSIMWVLCGETLIYGKQDSDNKDKNNTKDIVNVILELDNKLTLERKYKEVWKENDLGQLTFSRVDNHFFVNGAKFGMKEYFKEVGALIGINGLMEYKNINLLRALIDYNYLAVIDYKDVRKFYESILELKSDEELVEKPEFSNIANDLQLLRFDINKTLNKYNNDYKDLCSKIDTKSLLLDNLQEETKNFDANQLKELQDKQYILVSANATTTKEYQDLEKQINDLDLEIQNVNVEDDKAIEELNEVINNLLIVGTKNQTLIERYSGQISTNEQALYTMEHKKKIINDKINMAKIKIEEYKAQKFLALKCKHCGKIINDEEEELFNVGKEEQIYKKNSEINTYKKDLELANLSMQETKKRINDLRKEKAEIESQQEHNAKVHYDNKATLDELKEKKRTNEKLNELVAKRDELKKQQKEFIDTFTKNKNNELLQLNDKIIEVSRMSHKIDEIEKIKVELQNLKLKRALVETQKLSVNDFKQLKLKMIKDNISNVFKDVEIELVEESVTGAISEVCYAKLKGVEFNGMNNGHRYILGIKIIESLKQHLGLKDLPIIFDRLADIDNENLKEILKLTNSQIFATRVTSDNEITLKGE